MSFLTAFIAVFLLSHVRINFVTASSAFSATVCNVNMRAINPPRELGPIATVFPKVENPGNAPTQASCFFVGSRSDQGTGQRMGDPIVLQANMAIVTTWPNFPSPSVDSSPQ